MAALPEDLSVPQRGERVLIYVSQRCHLSSERLGFPPGRKHTNWARLWLPDLLKPGGILISPPSSS